MGDWDTLASAAAATANAAVGLAAPAIQGKTSWKYTKKAMDLQNQYNLAAFERNNERQDYLLQNAELIKKNALARAGYSTADPNGTGVSAPNVSEMQPPSGGQFNVAAPNLDIASAFSQIAQAKNIQSQTRLNDIESQYRAALLEGQIGKLNADIKSTLDLLPERVEEIRASVQTQLSQKTLNEETANKVIQETQNLAESLNTIKLDNKYREQQNFANLRKTNKEIEILVKEGRIKEAEAKIADLGIVLSHGTMAAIVSAGLSGKSGEIADALANSLNKLVEGLPKLVEDVIVGIFNGVKSAGKGAVNGFRKLFGGSVKDAVKEKLEEASKQ